MCYIVNDLQTEHGGCFRTTRKKTFFFLFKFIQAKKDEKIWAQYNGRLMNDALIIISLTEMKEESINSYF